MKKLLVVLFAALCVFALAACSTSGMNEDANFEAERFENEPAMNLSDGGYDLLYDGNTPDASYVNSNSDGKNVAEPSAYQLGDVNKDGKVTNMDILLIFRYIYNPELYPLEKLPVETEPVETTAPAETEPVETTAPAESETIEPEIPGDATEKTGVLSFADVAFRTEYNTAIQVWQNDGIIFTNNKASSTSNVGDYCNPARIYKSSEVVITVEGGKIITKVVITAAGEAKYKTAVGDSLTAAGYNYTVEGDVYTVEVNASNLTFVAAAQARVASIEVTYTDSASGEPTPEETTAPAESEPEETSAPAESESEETSAPVEPDPIEVTIPEAVALEDGTRVIVKGTVTTINTEWSDQYGNITVTITDEIGNTLYIYRLATNVVVGDVITVTGTMSSYNGMRQIAQGATAEITDHVEITPDAPGVVFPEADSELSIELAVTLGGALAHNTYTVDKFYVTGVITEVYNTTYGNMYITDGNGNVLTIYGSYNADGSVRYDALEDKPVAGDTVTIYGIVGQYNGNPQIKNGWIVAHTAVEPEETTAPAETEPVETEPVETEPTEPEIPGEAVEKSATISFATPDQRTTLETTAQVWQNEGIIFTNNKSNSTNAIADYSNPVRIYANSEIVVAVEGGKTITKVVFAINASKYVTPMQNAIAGTADGNIYTVDVNATELRFNVAAQVRFDSITVYYLDAASGEPAPEESTSVETEPVETESVTTAPVETEPVETTAPVETEPTETTAPVETEPVETEPVETEPVETEPVETEPTEEEDKILATFDLGANGSASHADGSDIGASKSYTSGDYTLAITGASKVYGGARDAKGNSCLKFGTSSVAGTITFTVPDDVEKVVIYVAKYKAKTSKITVNAGEAITINTSSDNGEYTAIEIDTSVNKTVTIATVSGGVRCMLNTIEFWN